jgi:HEAT repeat protein
VAVANSFGHSKIQLLLFACIGFVLGALSVHRLSGSDEPRIASLQKTISSLQAQLKAKEDELRELHQHASTAPTFSAAVFNNAPTRAVVNTAQEVPYTNEQLSNESIDAPAALDGVATLKDLETQSDNDPRFFADKLKDFLAGDADPQKAAIASRGIFDMANDRSNLPDYALQSMYNKQSDPNLKRVIAQVLSQRGNSFLLDNEIAAAQANLKSDQPADRQAALNELAKMRSVKAVQAILPYLQDPDVNVKLDALQALRDTGNQSHAGMLQTLVNDPDPAVSSLAKEVQSELKNLSSSARTMITRADIEQTLPPLPNS